MKYPTLSTEEASVRKRAGVLALAAPVFLAIIPARLILAGRALDRLLGLPRVALGWSNTLLGGLLGAVGFAFAMWSIGEQFTLGRGTPIPKVASQELVTTGPYAYTRNPMALGTILMYLGVAVWIGSLMATLIVALLGGLLLSYIKRAEEPTLAARFGDAYRAYRRRTPFLIPRLRR
jgi:protein-S-isoprenylcysteine O-methyltransferase Ste14